MIKFNFSFKTILLTLIAVMCFGVNEAKADEARIGSTNYASFKAAWNAALTKTNPTITLISNCTFTETREYSESFNNKTTTSSITLDLNGYTISTSTLSMLFKITAASRTLTITDNSANKSGIIRNTYTGNTSHCVQVTKGTLIVEAGTLECKNTGSNAIAINLSRTSTDNPHCIVRGTAKIYAESGSSGTPQVGGLYANGGGTIDVSGTPEIEAKTLQTSPAPTDRSRAIWAQNSHDTGTYTWATDSIEVNIAGGTFKSDNIVFQVVQRCVVTVTGGHFYTSGGLMINWGSSPMFILKGGYYNKDTKSGGSVVLNGLATPYGYKRESTPDDDIEKTPETGYTYTYRVVPTDGCEAKVKTSSETKWHYFHTFKESFDYAKTQDNATTKLLRNINYTGDYFLFNPSTAITNTLDLCGCTFTGNSTHATYNDRLLEINKAGATYNITSSADNGVFKHEKSKTGQFFGIVVTNGNLVVSSGKVLAKNTGGKVDATILANGANVTINGTGQVEAQASTNGGTVPIRLNSGTATVTGNAIITANTSLGTAYGLHVYGTGTLNVEENATINVTANTQGFGLFGSENSNSTVNISGGTFNVNGVDASSTNIDVFRVRAGSGVTLNITGGTFNSSTGSDGRAMRLNGGTTTISGTATFNTNMGILLNDYLLNTPAAGTYEAKLTINGGTFNTTFATNNNGSCVRAAFLQSGEVTIKSDVTINGGKFCSANSNVIWKQSVENAKLAVTGGYYSNNTNLQTYCVSPKRAFQMTSSECSSVGMPANSYKVVDAYTITWKNEAGTSTLETDANVAVGSATTFNGSTPTKAATAQYTYTFDGWTTEANGGGTFYANGSTPMVSGNATYYAHFSATLRNYTVTIVRNNDAYGTVDKASVTNVPYGSTFSTSGNKFTINGTTVTATPTAATAQYTYAFSSWTNASGTVTGNVTVTANFSRTTNNYTVTVQASPAGYGSVDAASIPSVPYGTAVSISGNKLTINGTTVTATAASTTAEYSYAFSSWSGAPATITTAVTITANFTRTPRTYTVTLNTNGGTINAGDVASYTYGTGATLPTNVTKDGYEFAGWYDNSGLTGSAVTTISTTATGNKEFWAKWTAATMTFTGATNSLWSTTTNWSSGVLPTAEHDVIIQKPCNVNVQDAKAKSIAIYNNGSDKTGQLIIGPNQALEVTGAITKTTNGSNRIATTPSDLILQSSSDGNASLVFDNTDNTKYTQATVETYSKATYPQGGTATWQYIGVPFANGIDALSNYYETWLYEWAYNGETWTWMAKSPGDVVNPWKGYCITQRTAGNVSPQGTLCPTATVDLDFSMSSGAGQNMVFANSWTAPIQITQMEPADFVNVNPTIYLFNTGLDEDGTGGAGTAPGTYRTITIKAAGVIEGSPTKISSAQGFYMKSSGTDAKVQLSYAKHVRPSGGNTIVNGPMLAPKRMQADKPEVMTIVAQGSRYASELYLLSREDFSRGYDLGWDGENINGTGAGPLMYTLREDGTKDVISAIPAFEGAIVGFHAGEDSEYTFSFSYNGDEVWYLNDLLTETSTLISAETTYTFATTDNDDTRFIISATPLAKTPQGIEGIQDSEASVQKQLINDKLYIIRNGRIYDATGKTVKNNK